MSRIYFHSRHGEAAVLGSERAWFGNLVDRFGIAMLDTRQHYDLIAAVMPDRHFEALIPAARADALGLALRFNDDPLVVDGKPYEAFSIMLNTVLAYGNDSMRFVARMHGQCEMHAWVAGENRAWLADIIEAAPSTICRADQGWEAAVALLRERDDEPVVTSYSVTESFPNPYDSDWMDGYGDDYRTLSEAQQSAFDERGDAWYELPNDEKWDRGLAWLSKTGGGLEMKPDDWATMRFRHNLDALQFIDMLRNRQPVAV